jgi:hypothetical protein
VMMMAPLKNPTPDAPGDEPAEREAAPAEAEATAS